VAAAGVGRGKPGPGDVIWALGWLAELYVLAPLADQSLPVDSAIGVLAEMKALV